MRVGCRCVVVGVGREICDGRGWNGCRWGRIGWLIVDVGGVDRKVVGVEGVGNLICGLRMLECIVLLDGRYWWIGWYEVYLWDNSCRKEG